METRFQTTSFIPKASLDNVVSEDGKIQKQHGPNDGVGTGSIISLICFFIFVCSLVSAGVVFSLLKLSASKKVEAEKSLTAYQKKNNAQTIVSLKLLSDRLTIIDTLIKNHVAISPLFTEISKNTLEKVSLTNFSLKRKNDGAFYLDLKAEGVGYESIVAQDKQLSQAPAQSVFKNTIISDFSKPKGQDIATFSIGTTIAGPAINFANLVGGSNNVDNSIDNNKVTQ